MEKHMQLDYGYMQIMCTTKQTVEIKNKGEVYRKRQLPQDLI